MAATVAADMIDFRIWAQLESCEKGSDREGIAGSGLQSDPVMNFLGTKALMAAIRA